MRKRVTVVIISSIFVISSLGLILWKTRAQKTTTVVDGALKWRYETGARVFSSPAIGSDGTIYVGSNDGYLYAINPDGTLKWRYQTGDYIRSSPAIGSDGTIYVSLREPSGNLSSYLYAIRPDGTLKWRYKVGDMTLSLPAIGFDGTIYVGGTLPVDRALSVGMGNEPPRFEGYLYAIKPNGTLKWRYKTDGGISSSPVIGSDGTIYVGSGTSVVGLGKPSGYLGYLYAINPDGTLKWRFKAGGSIRSSPAIGSDGTIYVGVEVEEFPGHYGYLYAIKPDGTLKWRFKVGWEIKLSPAIGSDGTIYVGSPDGYLYAINPDGTLKWRCKTGGYLSSLLDISSPSPAIGSDGTIYVGTVDPRGYLDYPGYLYAIKPNGTLKWRFKAGASIESSPAIGPDGTIYVGSDDHYLYAIRGSGKLADAPWPMFRHDLQHTGRAGK